MKKDLLHTQEGVRDIYSTECAEKKVIENRLHDVCASYGYNDIQTPSIEFFDVFNKERGSVPSNEMFKLFDRYGNTLVLRPDMTPSIARATAKYFEVCKNIWTIKCYVALPCATQVEIDAESAKILVENGTKVVAEGANMPSTLEAIEVFQNSGILFGPAKAANAGGVATSAIEMSQNSMRYYLTFDEVDSKLNQIMINIFNSCKSSAEEYNLQNNYVAGANIAAFTKLANAMIAQGIV